MTEQNLAEARLDIHDFVMETLTALSFDPEQDEAEGAIEELEGIMSTITSVLLDSLGLEVLSVDSTDEVTSYTVKLTLLGDSPEDDEEPSEG